MKRVYAALAAIALILIAALAGYTMQTVYGIDVIGTAMDLISENPAGAFILEHIVGRTPIGVFVLFCLLSIAIVPGPLEITFVGIVLTSEQKLLLAAMAIGGIICGQNINYWLGRLAGRWLNIQEKSRSRVERFGGWIIFFGNCLPFLPTQLFNTIAGATRMPYAKWLKLAAIATVIYFTGLLLFADRIETFLAR